MKPVLVLDVVGTLLDLSALDPMFREHFGQAELRKEWFSEVLKMVLTQTAIGKYEEFGRITEAALEVIARRHEKDLNTASRKEILGQLRTLPAFPEVKPALDHLHSQGFRLAALTNSGLTAAREALRNTGIAEVFERILSADSAKRLKPAAAPYRMAAQELRVGTASMLMVAAHSWDLAGAAAAGCQTAFIQRPQQVLDLWRKTFAIWQKRSLHSKRHDSIRREAHYRATLHWRCCRADSAFSSTGQDSRYAHRSPLSRTPAFHSNGSHS